MKKIIAILLMLVTTNLIAVTHPILDSTHEQRSENIRIESVELCKRGYLYLALVSESGLAITQMMRSNVGSKDGNRGLASPIPCVDNK